MKKFLVAAGVISSLILVACNDTKKEIKEEKAPEVPVVDAKGLKIAYYYSDSLKTGFKYYKQEDARITKKGRDFENELMSRERKLQEMAANYEKYMREGTATGEQIQNLKNEINRKRQELMTIQQTRGAALEKETGEALQVLSKKIEVAGKKYCEKYGIDMLLIHGQGGQINFIDEKMNVTQSFIEFLNAEHEKAAAELSGK